MTVIRSRSLPALVLVLVAAVLGLAAPVASAGVIAPPEAGGLTGSVQFSCEGRAAVPTVTVVVHNAYGSHFGVSVWSGSSLLGNLGVPGHTTRVATFSDPAFEDQTVYVDVLRIGGVVVASGSHDFDCTPGVAIAVPLLQPALVGTGALR